MTPKSVAGRVALAAGTSIALGGLSVALVAGLLAERFSRAREDEHLRGAATTLALELSEPGADPAWIAVDEDRELAHTGMRVAIFEGRTFVAGDRTLGPVSVGTCEDRGALRACAIEAGALAAIVARAPAALDEQRETTVLALAIAVVLVALLGAIAARGIARLSVAPLARLRAAVERVREEDPTPLDLGEDEGVAEVDALRASLTSALARLTVALSQARRFSADAAHELRTPLTAIIGELDLAAERSPSDDARDSIERASRTAARLATLVDRLLVLARTNARLDAAERVELLEVVEDAREALPPAERARVNLDARAAVELLGDRTLLVSMVANALENAVKHGCGAVTVTIDRAGDLARVTVADEGPGVPSEERERVFAPFYRTRASRAGDVPGHGVGLALIAHVAALHGGSARFAPQSAGARFEIILPRSPISCIS